MEDVTVRWVLKGGYSDFIEGSRLRLSYEPGPVKIDFDQAPAKLLRGKEPFEIAFRLAESLTAESKGGLRWKLSPSSRIRALLIPSGCSFLGNHKVPQDQFAVQWTVEGQVTTSVGRSDGNRFFEVEAGSRTSFIWVRLYAEDDSVGALLSKTWESLIDPLSCDRILSLPEGQFVTWSWTGSLKLAVTLNLLVDGGWEIGRSAFGANFKAALGLSAGLEASAQLVKQGDFTLRLSRRRGKSEVSILRRRLETSTRALKVGVSLAKGIQASTDENWIRPLLGPVNREVKKALARQVEIGLGLSSRSWKRKRILLKVTWGDSLPEESRGRLTSILQAVIGGRIPNRDPEISIQWSLEFSKGRQNSIGLNILDWLSFGRESTKEDHFAVRTTPKGDIVVVRGCSLDRLEYAWDAIQLMRLVETSTTGYEASESTEWAFSREGSFSQRNLRSILRAALHTQAVHSFDLPPKSEFPLDLRLVWVTRFDAQGLKIVRLCPNETLLSALVRAFELLEPARYQPRSFWRDWIDFPSVREVVDRNPVQAHLASLYPVPGRSEVQRRTVVSSYRRVKSFLRMAQIWREEPGSLRDFVEPRFEVPVFVLFHLLCPAEHRESGVLMTGDRQEVWGKEALLASR